MTVRTMKTQIVNMTADKSGAPVLFVLGENGHPSVDVELTESQVRDLYYDCGAYLQGMDHKLTERS